MLYYRVKPEFNSMRLLNRTTRAFDLALVGNELYTEKEWGRLVLRYRVSAVVCEPVQVNKRNTYFFFGARFESETKPGRNRKCNGKGNGTALTFCEPAGMRFCARKEMRCTTKTAIREPLCACKTGVCVVCGADVRLTAFLQTMVRQKRK